MRRNRGFRRAATQSCIRRWVVREGGTAGGESSSKAGVQGAVVRAVEVAAEGGSGGIQNTMSLHTFGSDCTQQLLPLRARVKVPQQQGYPI